MDNQKHFSMEFDPSRRIVWLSFPKAVEFRDRKQMDDNFRKVESELESYFRGERIYLVVDIHNLIIDPSLAEALAAGAKAIADKYVYPGGIARFGLQITRATIRRGYQDHLREDPNIFTTREEAEDYVESLIAKASARTA